MEKNFNTKYVCPHDPCDSLSGWNRFVNYCFFRASIVCEETETALCAYCKKLLVPPRWYYSSKFLAVCVAVELTIGLLIGMVMFLLGDYQPDIIFAITGLITIYAIWPINRIASSVVFAMQKWTPAEFELLKCFSMRYEDDLYCMEARRDYCKRQKSKRIIVQIICPGIIAILACLVF